MQAYETVADLADLDRINVLVGELVGQSCWRLEFSYGDELTVGFGAKLAYSRGPLAGELYGEWELATLASPWTILRPDGSEITNGDAEREETEPRFSEVTDRKVAAAAVNLPDLSLLIEFDDGKQLEVQCCEDSEDASSDTGAGGEELACWELYMPQDRLLAVWPGRRWGVRSYEK